MTVVTSEPFSQLDAEDLEDLAGGDLSGSLDKMTDAMDQLLDGSSQLCDGLDALLEGTNALSDGVDQLAGGLSALSANSARPHRRLPAGIPVPAGYGQPAAGRGGSGPAGADR